ncbi:hypothetical protein Y032_0450g1679 [Ancylostoma ceylanicum]|uniref:Uncharacterized protein n=1 Tax=Ancylostoma ceylanicum TaxID=53326 RepID=A0A016X0H8_9BILA|nr:hypothetical protein Y032_0450g1679 [Ancylostoma ceylanicum]
MEVNHKRVEENEREIGQKRNMKLGLTSLLVPLAQPVAKRSLLSKGSPRHRTHDRAAGGCDLNLTTSALSAVDTYDVQVT